MWYTHAFQFVLINDVQVIDKTKQIQVQEQEIVRAERELEASFMIFVR